MTDLGEKVRYVLRLEFQGNFTETVVADKEKISSHDICAKRIRCIKVKRRVDSTLLQVFLLES